MSLVDYPGSFVTSDTAPDDVVLQARGAFPTASSNVEGASISLKGGIGRRRITIVDYTLSGGMNITVRRNRDSFSNATEGTHWVGVASGSNSAAATNLAAALNSVIPAPNDFVAVASGADVFLRPGPDLFQLSVQSNTQAAATVTNDPDGLVALTGTDATSVIVGANVTQPTAALNISTSGSLQNVIIGDNTSIDGTGGTNSVVIGYNANATDAGSNTGDNVVVGASASAALRGTILGSGASSSGIDTVVIGTQASGGSNNSVTVVGRSASATGATAVVIGASSTAGANSVAIAGTATSGIAIKGTATNSGLAIGNGASSTANQSIAIGTLPCSASGTASICIGKGASDNGNSHCIVMGHESDGNGADAVCIGGDSDASANSVGLGVDHQAIGNNTICVGKLSSTHGNDAICVGYNSATGDGDNVTLMGTDVIVRRSGTITVVDYTQGAGDTVTLTGNFSGVQTGTEGADFNAVTDNDTTAENIRAWIAGLGGYTATRNGAVVTYYNNSRFNYPTNLQTGDASAWTVSLTSEAGDMVLIGHGVTTLDTPGAIAIGEGAAVAASDAIAIGNGASANGANGISIGPGISGSTSSGCVAVGASVTISGQDSTAVGRGATVANEGTAVGVQANSGSTSVAIGRQADATGGSSVAIGNQATGDASNGVILGNGADADGNSESTCVGSSTLSGGGSSTCVGFNARTTGFGGVAVGVGALLQGRTQAGPSAVAIGLGAFSQSGVCVGANSTSGLGASSTVVGIGSKVNQISTLQVVDADSIAATTETISITRPQFANDPLVGTEGTDWTKDVGGGDLPTRNINTATSIASWLNGLGGLSASSGGTDTVTVTGDLSAFTTSAADPAVLDITLGSNVLDCTIVGAGASANSDDAVVIGKGANTVQGQSVVIGSEAAITATGAAAIAIGYQASAGDNTVTIGSVFGNVANGVFIGDSSASGGGTGSVFIGHNTTNSGGGGDVVCIGASATGSSTSVVIGQGATGSGSAAVVVGRSATTASNANAFAIGASATVQAAGGFALGNNTLVQSVNSVSIGYASRDAGANTAAIGSRSSTGMQCVGLYLQSDVDAPVSTATLSFGSTASGTNIAGTSGIIKSGVGTGDATGATLTFQTPDATTSGSTSQTLVTRLVLGEGASTSVIVGGDDTATATPADTTIRQTDIITTANTAGPSLTIRSGEGTGNATGSSITFQTPNATGSGSTQQASATRLTITEAATTFASGSTVDFTGATIVGLSSPDNTHLIDDTNNASSVTGATLQHTLSSGTAAAGHGISMDYTLEDDAGNDDIAGRIDTVWASAASGSEQANMIISAMDAGALEARLHLSPINNGGMAIGSTASAIATGQFSTAIGSAATCAAVTGSTTLGQGASATAANSVAVGYISIANGASSVAIGQSASTSTTTNSVAVGQSAAATGNQGVAVGQSTGAGANSLALGYDASALQGSCIAIGASAATTAFGQMVVGSTTVNIDEIAMGYGAERSTTGAMNDLVFHTTDRTTQTDEAGQNLVIRSGEGTGSGAVTSVKIQTPDVLGTGTTQQSSVDRLELSEDTFKFQSNDAPTVFDVTASIDGTTVANTTLFTVPTGRVFVLDHILVHCTAQGGTSAGDMRLQVGTTAGGSDVIANQPVPLAAVRDGYRLDPGTGLFKVANAAELISLRVDTAESTATTLDFTARLVGTLV